MILNIYGILAIVIVSFLGFYLQMVWSSLFEGSYFGLSVGFLSVLVGVVMERLGARGRIFFMPVWLVGFLLAAYGTFLVWGVIGLVLPVIMALFAVWWMTRMIKKNDQKKWEYACGWMAHFRECKESPELPFFWQLVKESLYLPIGAHSTEACEHNLEIVRRILDHVDRVEVPKGIAVFYEFQEFLSETIKSDKPRLMDKKMEIQLLEFVSTRC